MSNLDGYLGTQGPETANDEFGATGFIVRMMLNARNHVALVRVVAVSNDGGLALAGTVDVLPLVNQLDGEGNAIAHGVVNDLPYVRMQGGSNAVIMDPQIGDIGFCVFADRDSSSVQATRDAANPGSARRSDMADGLYLGGMLNGIPTQYMMFTEDGIKLHSPSQITLEAPTIELSAQTVNIDATSATNITTPTFTVNGASQFNGTVSATGVVHTDASVTASSDMHAGGTVTGDTEMVVAGHGLKLHIHTGGTILGKTGPIV